MTRNLLSGLFGLGMAFYAGCGGEAPTREKPKAAQAAPVGCSTDLDCKGGRVCVAAKCQTAGFSKELNAQLDAGYVTLEILKGLVSSRECKGGRQISAIVNSLEQPSGVDNVAKALVARGPESDPGAALGSWLLLIDIHARRCSIEINRDKVIAETKPLHPSVSESVIDNALNTNDCGTLASVHTLNLWPYEGRFLKEVSDRDYIAAETTRRLWLSVLTSIKTDCSKRLTRRDVVGVEASLEKLTQIVGLNDNILMQLRDKLMDALAKGDADATTRYAQAVSQREQALDQRNAAVYEERMKTLETQLQEAKKATAVAAATPAAQNGKPQPLAEADQAVSTAKDAVNTAKGAIETVNLARQVFGF